MNKLLVSRNENGTVTTTSLKIAEVFGKKHKNILRDIENIKQDIPTDFWELNFELSNYEVKTGRNTVTQNPMYLLTRDAFTLLAMGFTGREALQWKLKYIEAFNAMEDRLKELAAEQRKIRQDTGSSGARYGKFRLFHHRGAKKSAHVRECSGRYNGR